MRACGLLQRLDNPNNIFLSFLLKKRQLVMSSGKMGLFHGLLGTLHKKNLPIDLHLDVFAV